jgi:hypothetical protein
VPSPPRPPSRAKPRRRTHLAPPSQRLGSLETDVRAARELLDDLAALMKAGLVAPVREGAAVRYGVIDNGERRAHR